MPNFSRSVQGLRSSDTPKLPFPINLLRRPYNSVRTAVRNCDYYFFAHQHKAAGVKIIIIICFFVCVFFPSAHLTLGFLDDVTLGGPVKTVASDVAEIIRVGSELGLSLNITKCELTE